ncbi:MAG: maltose alpha-D-glucosyltransferase [Thermoflexales bacterium]|nr:maltose alpha-D-glucosyltransferase [Thermoflexales bacterium]
MTNSASWYQTAVFYELHVRAFSDSNGDGHGDLRGLITRLDYLRDLGVNCVWLLPINPSPLHDDGYDVADYRNIHPDFGTLDDFRELIAQAHQRGLRILMDLVLNHTSEQHAWFQAARSDRHSPYRDFYVWSDTDQKYADVRIVFCDVEPSNWTWDEVAGQYYWHRFYRQQPDLNYDNPAVRAEMLDVARFWLDLGVDGFRLDAVTYLFEREGTDCAGLPETHAYLKDLRRLIDTHYPDRVLLCEANLWPGELRAYFGGEINDECQMGFHFPLMPRVFMALAQADRTPIVEILAQTPQLPAGAQWATFLRNHDELTLEMVTPEERDFMWQTYAPEPRMKINLGIRRRLAPLLNHDARLIKLANSILLTLTGSPVLYYGDEIGLGDNIWLDDRNGVRTPMPWNSSVNAGFSATDHLYAPLGADYATVNVAAQQADPASVLNWFKHALHVRQQHPALGQGELHWLPNDQPALLAYWRIHHADRVLVINNLSAQVQAIDLPADAAYFDLLSKSLVTQHSSLQPYQCLWLTPSIAQS